VKASIVRIGNSQGIRIPKVVLEQTRLSGEVELEVRDRQIVIRPVAKPRQGWAQKFRAMAERGDDKLLDADAVGQTSWDKEEWQWK
jgi:antitoxin MazE